MLKSIELALRAKWNYLMQQWYILVMQMKCTSNVTLLYRAVALCIPMAKVQSECERTCIEFRCLLQFVIYKVCLAQSLSLAIRNAHLIVSIESRSLVEPPSRALMPNILLANCLTRLSVFAYLKYIIWIDCIPVWIACGSKTIERSKRPIVKIHEMQWWSWPPAAPSNWYVWISAETITFALALSNY